MMVEEWDADSGGKATMDQDAFFDAIFTVADMWTDDTQAVTYVEFLNDLMDTVRGVWQEALEARRGTSTCCCVFSSSRV